MSVNTGLLLQPGQKGTYSGHPATVVRHYHGDMYEIRVPGGLACVGASEFTPEEAAEAAPVGGDCSHLHLYQRTHAGFVRITAIIAGEDAANAHMRANPGQALLSLVGETVAVLADVADTGVPEADIPAPEPYYTVFCREVDDEGTTWIGGTHAASARDAIIQCRADCAAEWDYGEDSVRVIGVASGDVDILEWDDENDLAQAEEPQEWP